MVIHESLLVPWVGILFCKRASFNKGAKTRAKSTSAWVSPEIFTDTSSSLSTIVWPMAP